MAASDLSTVQFIYKKNYSDKQVRDLTTRDHVWYAMLTMEAGFTGLTYDYTIRSGNPQGIGGTLAGAQAERHELEGSAVLDLSRREVLSHHARRRGDRRVARQQGRVLRPRHDGDGQRPRRARRCGCAFDFYRDTNCMRGRRASAATNVITMSVADDARNFKEGMTVGASVNIDGSAPRAGHDDDRRRSTSSPARSR
jgi:hypothetical protein